MSLLLSRAPIISSGSGSSSQSDEIIWMVHRAILEGPEGLFFYTYLRSTDDLRYAVKNVVNTVKNNNLHVIFDSSKTNKDSLADNIEVPDKATWGYRYYNDAYWLLVMDSAPYASGTGTRDIEFECDLENQTNFNDFEDLFSVYDGNTTISTSDVSGTYKKKFTDTLDRGEVKLYKFLLHR